MKSKVIVGLVAVIVCVLIAWGIVYALTERIEVEAAAAKMGRIHTFVDERAITRLPETYLITMPAAGRIEAIPLTEGTRVEKGQEVAEIVPRDLDLAVEQATAAKERLAASIKENADNSVEETAFEQAKNFVKSMGATVQAAAARVTAGRAKFNYAESDYGRIQNLAATRTKSRDDLEQAKVRKVEAGVDYQQDQLVHTAMIALDAATDLMPTMVRQFIGRKKLKEVVLQKQEAEAEAHLQQVEQDRERGKMYSPVNGVVLRRWMSNERFLPAGEPLLEIGRLEDLEVETDILTLDVVRAKVGDPVKIYGPAIGTARGEVAEIYPAGFTKISSLGVEQQRVKVIIHFKDEDRQRLLAERNLGVGYRVRVQITTAEKPEVLVIPRSALFRGPEGQWQVYAIGEGRAKKTRVEVGLSNDEIVEILDGLSAGTEVVLTPESNLSNGARVKVKEESEADQAGP